MTAFEYFAIEMNNPDTNYFIFDAIRSSDHSDIDFVQYVWHRSRYNKVKEGDLALFRRPGKDSETGKFYFFGAAKIGNITGSDRFTARLIKPYPFKDNLYPNNLQDFNWTFKQRGSSWEHFFNQYGMNQINKLDFINLLNLEGSEVVENYDPSAATEATQSIQSGNYNVDDREGTVKIRTKQYVFSNCVKTNYNNQCAVCSISTRHFLIGSHIIPWSNRTDIRLDPSNGLCLCSLHDKAFDKGYFKINPDYTIKLSDNIKDTVLRDLLVPFNGKRIKLPKRNPPKVEYLNYHEDNIFDKF